MFPNALMELLPVRLNSLGPGTPNEPFRAKIEAFDPMSLGLKREYAAALKSAVWLHHDFLDESHALSQDLQSSTGSWLHGIMHRREPDAFNAKYWFRQLGQHTALPDLKRAAAELGYADFHPDKFVDDCERERDSGSEREMLLMAVQAKELEVLIGWMLNNPG